MDVNEYISSGILELYVAGALTTDEDREVETIAGEHKEVRDEIDAIAAAFCELTAAQSIEPRSGLRETVLTSVHQPGGGAGGVDLRRHSNNGTSAHHATIEHVSSPISGSDTFTVSAGEGEPRGTANRLPAVDHRSENINGAAGISRATVIALPPRTRYLVAASIIIAAVSSMTAAYFAYQWKSAARELASLGLENRRMVEEREALKVKFDRNRADLAVLLRDENVMVRMKGLPPATQAAATVYWNPRTHELHLDRGTLPPLPAERQYQLWAIADGKPVDAGVISKEDAEEGLQKMKGVPRADAFAVTLEPDGGSASPTLGAMYLIGRIDGSSI